MIGKDIKGEARKKLALNMHQAIIVYTVEFAIFITLIALVVMSCVAMGAAVSKIAAIVMICYGSLLFIIAIVGAGMINFAMSDFYLVSYRCAPYNIRRLGETIARSNITKVLLVSLKRTLIGFLLLLCLIVPGVIYLMRTSMASFLLIANPKMKPSAALTASNKVMSGKTGAYFSLCMSLIGWYLLGILTLGLGFIFITPYINLVKTVFYKRNLQGDKGVYTVSPQTLASVPYGVSKQGQPITGQMSQPMFQQMSQPMQAAPAGPAPIDALADDDVMDMNAAIKDFGGSVDDVPEVPLGAPVKAKAEKPEKPGKTKLTREEKRMAKEAAKQEAQTHKIDGTGLVETERTLTTQELTDSVTLRRNAIESMYSNTERKGPNVNYFDMNATDGTDDFEDDFGVTPITDDEQQAVLEPVNEFVVEPEAEAVEPMAEPFVEAVEPMDAFDEAVVEPMAEPIIEPIVQEQSMDTFDTFDDGSEQTDGEPIISDSELDEFLRNFDTDEQAEAVIEPEAVQPEQTAHTDRAAQSAADRRRLAEERIERDRRAAAERMSQTRPTPVSHGDLSDRAERIRREREERLKNLNQKK